MSVSFMAVDSRVSHDYPRSVELPPPFDGYGLNLCNANARALLGLLRLPLGDETYGDLSGQVTIAEARRAVIRARASFERRAELFTRATEREMGAFSQDDGTTRIGERFVAMGIDEDYLDKRLSEFGRFVEAAAEAGADHICWG